MAKNLAKWQNTTKQTTYEVNDTQDAAKCYLKTTKSTNITPLLWNALNASKILLRLLLEMLLRLLLEMLPSYYNDHNSYSDYHNKNLNLSGNTT